MSSSKKTMADLETEVNSPPKRTEPTILFNTSANKSLNLYEVDTKPSSLT